MPINHLLCISDTHCGGSTALLHENFVNHEGNPVGQNDVQKWLWQAWRELWDVWLPQQIGDTPFALVLNGDATEGVHHHTKEVVSYEPSDHIRIAAECIAPEIEASNVDWFGIVEGTDCHVGNGEHSLAKMLGGKAYPRLDCDINGVRTIVQHHISTSARIWTESTALGTALANEQLEAARAGEDIPRVLLSAHRHRPGLYQTTQDVSGVTGAWQALTRHGRKVVPSARLWVSAILIDYSTGKPRAMQFDRKPPSPARIQL